MSSTLQPVWIHPSQFPGAVQLVRERCLRETVIDHQFHYQSARQSELWLALHQRYAPLSLENSAPSIYRDIVSLIKRWKSGDTVHVVALGCGGGEKDVALIEELKKLGLRVRFTPVDVSVNLAIHSAQSGEGKTDFAIRPMVADLRAWVDLLETLDEFSAGEPRVFTFYGLLPNFEPAEILPRLKSWLRSEDTLLLSANLAPVTDESEAAYRAAMEVVLPQYRNAETLDWVGRVLTDWGLETQVGEARVTVEKKSNLYRFLVSTSGKSWQLFFSYRHTPERLRMLLSEYSLELGPGLISAAKEEGVWRVNVKH